MRILIVEDNPDILSNVFDYLQLKGYTVDCEARDADLEVCIWPSPKPTT